MEIYQSEEQQVEAIKGFWKENGNSIIAGLVVGFAGFIGFNVYQDNKLANEMTLSDSYQTILETASTDEQKFLADGEAFVATNSDSSYASLTAFALAQDAVSHQDWTKAATYLTSAVEKAPTDAIKGIATIRLARVHVQLAQYEEALALLATSLPEAYKASIEEVKGDIYLLQGKNELARNAYQAAIDADGLATNPALQIKLDDLAQVVNLTK